MKDCKKNESHDDDLLDFYVETLRGFFEKKIAEDRKETKMRIP